MSEKCETCNGKGALIFQPRTYEYPTFSTPCRDCDGTGMHPRAFSLSMRGERELREAQRAVEARLREDEYWAKEYADTFIGSEETPPKFADWVAEQKAAEEAA